MPRAPQPKPTRALAWKAPTGASLRRTAAVVRSFLDVAATSFGKATHYDTELEVQAAERATHDAMLAADRDLYAALLTIPGLTDRARALGLRNLLAHARAAEGGLLGSDGERVVVEHLAHALPPPRMLRLFESFRVAAPDAGILKVNNARARKLVLRSILGAKNLELWAVKYREKLRRSLVHALGEKKAGMVRAIASKGHRTPKEDKILREEIGRHAQGDLERAYECVAFVLGGERPQWSVELLRRFDAAKTDLQAGKGLPLEVLEGIRGQHHPDVTSAEVLALAQESMGQAQRLAVQRRAGTAGVEVKVDWARHDAVRLYLFAFEMGMTDEVAAALDERASGSARRFPLRHEHVGILVDASGSMAGDETQRLRPIATALALRDVLARIGPRHTVRVAGGRCDGRLIHPEGDTRLADGLLDLVEAGVDAVYVLSDGYENAPGGRFAEVVAALDRADLSVPIRHLDPVVAAEVGGVRELAPDRVATLPIVGPDGIGLSLLRAALVDDPAAAIAGLLRMSALQERNA